MPRSSMKRKPSPRSAAPCARRTEPRCRGAKTPPPLAALCAVAWGIGCGNALDPSSNFGGRPGSGGSMSASIDGEAWEAGIDVPGVPSGLAVAVAGSRRADPGQGGQQLIFTGTRSDGSAGDGITISFFSNSGFPLGEYTVRDEADADGTDATGFAQVQWRDQTYDAISGTLSLNDMDGSSASGTFEFVARDGAAEIAIGNGRFSSTYMDL